MAPLVMFGIIMTGIIIDMVVRLLVSFYKGRDGS